MARTKPKRKKVSQTRTAKELIAYRNVQHLLKDLIIGSVQIKDNAHITQKGNKLLEAPSVEIANAISYVKFHWKFLLGYVGRKENGIPYCKYEFVNLNHHSKLYTEELDKLIFDDLRRMFKEADHNTRLTTFWIASPNPEMEDVKLLTNFYQLMDKYRVFDNMITQYEINTNKDVGRSLHSTTYWYDLCEFEEIILED